MAGAGYKLFNTGDVLTAAQVNTYLQEQVVMVFNDATARTTALSGVLAEGMVTYLKSTKVVEIYNGTAWASLDDPNAIQNTIVDAKGDLISASGNDVPARLAVGNNGETLVADSSATTGLRWQGTQAAGRNIVINGGMDIWQRSTSISLSASSGATYTADRWQVATGANQASVVSRQTISDSTNLPFIQYAMRVQRNSGQTGTATTFLASSFESANSIIMANRTVTLSFYARAGANYSPSSSSLPVNLVSGTGNDQNVFSGLTGQANIVSQTATLTTTWQRFTYSGNVANTTTQLALYFSFNPTGTAGANDWFEITGIQVEVGSVATQFTRAGGTLAGELAACQRYYQKSYNQGTAPATNTTDGLVGTWATAVDRMLGIRYPVVMRVAPTVTIYSSNGTSGKVTTFAGVDAGGSVIGDLIGDAGYRSLYTGTNVTASTPYSYHYTLSSEL